MIEIIVYWHDAFFILDNYLIPKEDISDEEECPFPTLEEAADMVKERRESEKKRSVSQVKRLSFMLNFEIYIIFVTIKYFQPEEEFVGLEEPEEDIGKRVPPLYEFKQDCVIGEGNKIQNPISRCLIKNIIYYPFLYF